MKNNIKTKIVATLGPSSNTKEMIKELVEAGVTMFRLNSSHGDFEQHLTNLKYINSSVIRLARSKNQSWFIR